MLQSALGLWVLKDGLNSIGVQDVMKNRLW